MTLQIIGPFADSPHRQNKNGYWYTKWNGEWTITGRLVLSFKLGRSLLPTERVKYKDNDRDNNLPDNLEINPYQAWSSAALIATRIKRLKSRQAALLNKRDLIDQNLVAIENELIELEL